ncbi:hypothetical protein ACLBXX_16255 [Microbacterium sp. C23T]
MTSTDVIAAFVHDNDGVLPVRPTWIAHNFLEPGLRLGLAPEDYDQGERGLIMERWLCSETLAGDDASGEGLSELDIPGESITVADAIARHPVLIMGENYAATHDTLGRLVKIFDFGTRLFFHMHQRAEHLQSQGKVPKDEAYHFLDAPMGDHPESFFGVQRFLVERGLHLDYFRDILNEWTAGEADVLKYSMGFVNVPGEGFLIDSGILHAPGTALTLEIQEPSDVGAIMQPVVQGHAIDKTMLFKDVEPDEVAARGVDAVLDQVDWDASSDPRFFEHRHLRPIPIECMLQGNTFEEWIYYGTTKFSGKRLRVDPGAEFLSVEEGVHSIFVWRGEGQIGRHRVVAGAPELHRCEDELLVCHEAAVRGYSVKNTGSVPLVVFKFFGPDLNGHAPQLGYGL